jgi:hypothetical protein
VYKGPEGQTTQWEDIQVKLGNMAPRAPKHKPPKYEGEPETQKDAKWLQDQDEGVLSDHEDDFTDDRELELMRCMPFARQCRTWHSKCRCHSSSCIISTCSAHLAQERPAHVHVSRSGALACRQRRLAELKEASTRPVYTSLELIRASDFKSKVTDASMTAWVVILLFQDGCALSHTVRTVPNIKKQHDRRA